MPDEPLELPEEETEEMPVSIGGGVAKIPELKPEDTQDEMEELAKREKIDNNLYENTKDGSLIITGNDGRAKWSTMPQRVGMLQNDNMYRTGPPQVKIFTLPDDLDAYNAFLKKAGNTGINLDGDPELVLETNHEEFWRGKFYVRITYRNLFYRQLQNMDR